MNEAIAAFAKDAASRYNLLRGDPQRPLLEPKELFLDAEQFFVRVKDFARLDIVAERKRRDAHPLPDRSVARHRGQPPRRYPHAGIRAISCKISTDACCCWPTAWGGARSFPAT